MAHVTLNLPASAYFGIIRQWLNITGAVIPAELMSGNSSERLITFGADVFGETYEVRLNTEGTDLSNDFETAGQIRVEIPNLVTQGVTARWDFAISASVNTDRDEPYNWSFPNSQSLYDALPSTLGTVAATLTLWDGQGTNPFAAPVAVAVADPTVDDAAPETGDAVLFTCGAVTGTATGAITYQWQSYDGTTWTDIANQVSSTYSHTETTAGTVTVRCAVTRAGTTVNSGEISATWTAPPPPLIVAAPTVDDATPTTGDTVVFTCGLVSGTATGATTYQWQDYDGSTWADIVNQVSNTYSHTENAEGTVTVRCEVTRDGNTVNSAQISATWSDAPIVKPNADAPAVEITGNTTGTTGTAVRLTASLSGGTYDSVSYQWTGGDIVGGTTGRQVLVNRTSAGNANVSVQVTARGTGSNAAAGTSDTARDTHRVVFTFVDNVAPILRSTTVNGTRLILTWSENLDTGSVPAPADFNVQVAGARRTVSSVSVAGRTVTLVLSSAVSNGQTVSVSYGAGTNPIQDTAGNNAPGLASQAATNNTPAPGPTGRWVYRRNIVGAKGDEGAKGDKGDRGPMGPKGDKGDPGDAANQRGAAIYRLKLNTAQTRLWLAADIDPGDQITNSVLLALLEGSTDGTSQDNDWIQVSGSAISITAFGTYSNQSNWTKGNSFPGYFPARLPASGNDEQDMWLATDTIDGETLPSSLDLANNITITHAATTQSNTTVGGVTWNPAQSVAHLRSIPNPTAALPFIFRARRLISGTPRGRATVVETDWAYTLVAVHTSRQTATLTNIDAQWVNYDLSNTSWSRATDDLIVVPSLRAIDITAINISAIRGDFRDLNVTGVLTADHISADVRNWQLLWQGTVGLRRRSDVTIGLNKPIPANASSLYYVLSRISGGVVISSSGASIKPSTGVLYGTLFPMQSSDRNDEIAGINMTYTGGANNSLVIDQRTISGRGPIMTIREVWAVINPD